MKRSHSPAGMSGAAAAAAGALLGGALPAGALLACALLAGAMFACTSKETGAATKQAPPGVKPAGAGQVIAVVDDVTITSDEFLERINKQSPYIRARYTSQERKKEFLDNLIRFEVLAKEAQRQGFDKDPEVVRTMKQVMIQKLTRAEFDRRVTLADITDAEIASFYQDHSGEYNKPEQVRASHIVVKDEGTARKVLAETRERGKDNRGFRELVDKYSIDAESKARGGDLRYFGVEGGGDAEDTEAGGGGSPPGGGPAPAGVPKAIAQAAFAIERIGDVAGPVQSDAGWHVVKLTGRRKAIHRSLEEVKRQIQNRLYREKRTGAMEQFVKELREKANVQVFEDRLAAVPIDVTTPSGPPGDIDPAFPGPAPAP